jgi:hypothetical protein
VYYGNIDKTKIDEISLDLYALYGTSDVAAMEEKAIDFTRRIITKRLEVFCGDSAEIFFANYKSDDLWQSLFYATMANPRNLGYVLFYLYESQLILRKYNQRSSDQRSRAKILRGQDRTILCDESILT